MERVLIIDNDPVSLTMTQKVAVKAGYAPTSVQTTEEAISLLLKNDYACLVVDSAANGVDAQLVISLAKTRDDAIPVIVVARDSSLVAERRLRELGVFYYMVKPVDVLELEKVFQTISETY